jgi:hypothetical protein
MPGDKRAPWKVLGENLQRIGAGIMWVWVRVSMITGKLKPLLTEFPAPENRCQGTLL